MTRSKVSSAQSNPRINASQRRQQAYAAGAILLEAPSLLGFEPASARTFLDKHVRNVYERLGLGLTVSSDLGTRMAQASTEGRTEKDKGGSQFPWHNRAIDCAPGVDDIVRQGLGKVITSMGGEPPKVYPNVYQRQAAGRAVLTGIINGEIDHQVLYSLLLSFLGTNPIGGYLRLLGLADKKGPIPSEKAFPDCPEPIGVAKEGPAKIYIIAWKNQAHVLASPPDKAEKIIKVRCQERNLGAPCALGPDWVQALAQKEPLAMPYCLATVYGDHAVKSMEFLCRLALRKMGYTTISAGGTSGGTKDYEPWPHLQIIAGEIEEVIKDHYSKL